jgi:adenylate cyclase
MNIPLRIGGKQQTVLIITLAWTFVLTFAYTNNYFQVLDLVKLDRLSGEIEFWPDLLGNVILGVAGGLVGGYLLVYKVNYGYRQRSFLSGIIRSVIGFVILFFFLAVVLIFLMGFLYFAFLEGIGPAYNKAMGNVLSNLNTPSFFVTMAVWALVVLGTQFMLQVNDKFGQGVLWKFLTGKYYHPRDEERIFMFLDLRGSTTIAENIGSTLFFSLLKDLFRDITEPVIVSQGEIHQYVGDEVVVTWTVSRGLKNDNCIQCFFRICAALEARKEYYCEVYGVAPELKAGLHIGEATVGEIGVIKKDIVYLGDVMNTASRIQGECNKYEVNCLISSELLEQLPKTTNYTTEPIGEIQLRGRQETIELHSVTMVVDDRNAIRIRSEIA